MADAFTNQPDPINGARDLFLSYNSRDRAAVMRVRQLLAERNISTFFDRDQLRAGSRWVSLLESRVGNSRGVAVCIGPHGLGDWQEMEMQFALVRQINEKKAGRSFPVIPLILPGATPEKGTGFLELYTWVDLRGRLDDPAAIDELERVLHGDVAAQTFETRVDLCPYRALQAFREQDEKLFFGRDRFAEQLLEKARDEKLKLIAVVGPSGSGKSSVVQAGLLPRLHRERPPYLSWESAIFTPGKAPFHNLAAALVTVGTAEQDRWERLGKAEKLGQDLADGVIRLEAALATALAEAPGANRLLLIVDQAEELFTLTPEQDRKPFVQRLLAAAESAPVTIVLTLRADFYSQAISFSRELGELITQGQVNILPMSRDELRQAIVAPADSVELKFEDGLVDRILDHIEDQPGNLPLLEYALTELWNRRQGKLLTNAAYQEIGGVEGAISRRAEEQFNRLSPAQQETAQRVLTRLVRVAAATEEGTDTRQRVRLSELDASAREVVRAFADVRLLVTNRIEIKDEETGKVESEEIVEVAHEALIRSWQRLKELLNFDRQFLLWRQRLGLMLKEWHRTRRDDGALLRGALLDEARQWSNKRGQDLTIEELEFISWPEGDDYQIKQILSSAYELIPFAEGGAEKWYFTITLCGYLKAIDYNDFKYSSSLLSVISTALAISGRIDEALQVASKHSSSYQFSQSLAIVCRAKINAHKIDEAAKIADKILFDGHQALTFLLISEAQAKVGEIEESQEWIKKAFAILRTESLKTCDRDVLAELSEVLARMGKAGILARIACTIKHHRLRAEVLSAISEGLANASVSQKYRVS